MRGVLVIITILILSITAYSLNPVHPELNQPIESPQELNSPYDWISEDQIDVFNDKVIINIPNARWARFTDTNSMDPLIDENSNAIQIIPTSTDDIHIGDVISYESEFIDGIVIHRVIELGNDGEWFAIVKGDNNPSPDPTKIRFNQIKRVLVAVIY